MPRGFCFERVTLLVPEKTERALLDYSSIGGENSEDNAEDEKAKTEEFVP
jgi:hypothetical protein